MQIRIDFRIEQLELQPEQFFCSQRERLSHLKTSSRKLVMIGNHVFVGGVVGLTASSIFFGANLGMSFIFIPTLLLAAPPSASQAQLNGENTASLNSSSSERPAANPSHLARQWLAMYDIGKKAGPFFALLATGSWLYTALQVPAGFRTQQRLFAAASFLSIAILPFTFAASFAPGMSLSFLCDHCSFPNACLRCLSFGLRC